LTILDEIKETANKDPELAKHALDAFKEIQEGLKELQSPAGIDELYQEFKKLMLDRRVKSSEVSSPVQYHRLNEEEVDIKALIRKHELRNERGEDIDAQAEAEKEYYEIYARRDY
jgi:hypothetical protein